MGEGEAQCVLCHGGCGECQSRHNYAGEAHLNIRAEGKKWKFIIPDPAGIPVDYFAPLRAHTALPLKITEMGWPTQDPSIPGLLASEQADADFHLRMLTITDTESLDGLIWAFPNNPNTGEANGLFDFISLRSNDGTAKQAYDYWQALRSL